MVGFGDSGSSLSGGGFVKVVKLVIGMVFELVKGVGF